MARSPIEMMIDQATGNDPSKAPPRVTLHCPKCRRTKRVLKDETDPEGTAKVEVVCDKCDDGGGFPEIHYYDAAGRWFDGETFRTLKTR